MIEISPELLTILMFLGLLIGLFMGHSLAFVLGGLAVIFGLLSLGPSAMNMFVTRTFGLMNNYVLIAVPLFILMAQFLGQSRVSDDLFDSLRYLLGPVRGGVGIAVVVVSVLFAACTGIVGASVVSMGLIALPLMMKYGYDKQMSAGLICAGGTLGILIPPSIMLVVMGSETGLSVGQLYAGAVFPGLLLGLFYLLYVAIRCGIDPSLGPPLSAAERASVTKRWIMIHVLKSLVPPSILILGVLGSIFTGIATPTEAAGAGAILSLVLAIAYKRFSWSMLYQAVVATTQATSMVMMVAVGATCFTGVFLTFGGGQVVTDFILGLDLGKWGTIAIMMIIITILGMFIDWLGIVFITFPIFVPIAQSFGFDKLWFVVLTSVCLQNSFLSPPFGYALFYIKAVAPPEITSSDIWKGVVPYIIMMCFGVVACLVLPELILWLPRMFVK